MKSLSFAFTLLCALFITQIVVLSVFINMIPDKDNKKITVELDTFERFIITKIIGDDYTIEGKYKKILVSLDVNENDILPYSLPEHSQIRAFRIGDYVKLRQPEMGIIDFDYKEDLNYRTYLYLLAPIVINFFIILSIGICLMADCTRWWFVFWIIIFGVLPNIYTLVYLINIQKNLKQINDIRDQVDKDGNLIFSDKEERTYFEKLKYAIVVMFTLHLIVFLFLFLCIVTKKNEEEMYDNRIINYGYRSMNNNNNNTNKKINNNKTK